MSYPYLQLRSIRILGIDYELKPMEAVVAECAECAGFIDSQKAVIFIREDLNSQVMAQTILHEALHGLVDGMAASESDDGDEALVTRLGVALTQFMRDNRNLVDWIQEQL